MKRLRLGIVLTVFTLTAAQPVLAAVSGSSRDHSATRYALSYTPVFETTAGLTGGGEITALAHLFSADVKHKMGRRLTLGGSVRFEYTEFEFDGEGFAALNPWSSFQFLRAGLSADWRFAKGWSLTVRPSLSFALEAGGDWSEAEIYGLTLVLTRRFSRSFILGTGVGLSRGLEATSINPLLIVIWQISDHWLLTNPFRPGPTDPTGLELSRTLGRKWQVGFGTAYRSQRFRLDNGGFAPGGIGKLAGEFVWLRLSRIFGSSFSLDLWGGTVFWGQVAVEDPDGHRLTSASVDPAPIFAATLNLRF